LHELREQCVFDHARWRERARSCDGGLSSRPVAEPGSLRAGGRSGPWRLCLSGHGLSYAGRRCRRPEGRDPRASGVPSYRQR
jgi:hypothetical protein